MPILIISRNPELQSVEAATVQSVTALWPDRQVQVAATDDIAMEQLQAAELLVVVGLPGSSETVRLEVLSMLMNAMLSPELPVLAAGWGFEIACQAYGLELTEEYERAPGAIRLEPTSKGEPLFQGSDPIRLAEGQRWPLEEAPKGLQVLARSASGIEAMMNKAKTLYALQQLPGDFAYPSDAKLVYQNLLELLGYTER